MSKFYQFLLGGFLVVIGINMVGLWMVNYLTLQKLNKLTAQSQTQTNSENLTTSSSSEASRSGSAFTQESVREEDSVTLLESIQTRLASLAARLTVLEKAASTSVGSEVLTAKTTQSTEQTIYIGSGSLGSTQWKDLKTAIVEVNSYNYPNLKHVVFEATFSVVSGEAFVRLKNEASGNILHSSEVTHNTSSPTIKISQPFGLDSGSNQYVVQLRSSNGEVVQLESARLRIVSY